MELNFVKYHGAGNDFVVIDDRNTPTLSRDQIAYICHRRFGVGADGILLLGSHETLDFTMTYINNDGSLGPMCGNGARCVTHFAKTLGIIGNHANFECNGSTFSSEILEEGKVKVKMLDVIRYYQSPHGIWVDAKTPHLIIIGEPVDEDAARIMAPELRYDPFYGPDGTNVNYCHENEDGLYIVTYERGIEDITWACGTGAISGALAFAFKEKLVGPHSIRMTSKGGALDISFNYQPDTGFTDVYMTGPVSAVFKGTIQV